MCEDAGYRLADKGAVSCRSPRSGVKKVQIAAVTYREQKRLADR